MMFGLIKSVAAFYSDPSRVIEVREGDYARKKVLCQDEILTLYNSSDFSGEKYDIVLKAVTNSTEYKMLSIYRTSQGDKAEILYLLLKEKLPLLFQCVPDITTSNIGLHDVVQAIEENPSWSIVHILAHLGYTECFRNELVLRQMSNMDESCTMTPLHVAVKAQQLVLVSALLERGVPVNAIDADGNAAFHYAAMNTTETIEMIDLLVEHGCDVDLKNFNGDTALHLVVRQNRLPSVITLLSHKVNVNLQNSDGDTALHIAVKLGNTTLVQALIIFGADLDLLNNQGESARHITATYESETSGELLYVLHVVGAKRCSDPMHSCNEGCSVKGQFNGIPPAKCKYFKTAETLFEELLMSAGCNPNVRGVQRGNSKDYRILCLDGGGIRGMVLIQMLSELERILQKPIVHCFDFIAGTSTGGILALVLAAGKTVEECRCLYFRLKDKVFVGMRPYDTNVFEMFLKKELGENTVMGDIKEPKIMITATRGDRQPTDLHIFRNYSSAIEILNSKERDSLTNELLPDPKQELIWKVARATGAAPTYFRPSGKYIDGGLIANNPTMDSLTEIHQRNEAFTATAQPDQVRHVKVVLSLGCGRPPLVATTPCDLSVPSNIFDACNMAVGASNLIRLLVDQASQTDGRVTSRTQAFCKMLNIPYFRMNPQLSEDVLLDETKTEVLVKMLWETTAYMRCMRPELEILKEFLV